MTHPLSAFPVFAGLANYSGWTHAFTASGEGVAVPPGGERAFLDICAHRSAVILNGDMQAGDALVCPYHGWTFGRDGRCAHGGRDLRCASAVRLGPVVLVAPQENPTPPERLDDVVRLFSGLRETLALCAHRSYTVRSHWTYWVENFLECLHCAMNHPQLSSVEAFIGAVERGDHAKLGRMYQDAHATFVRHFGAEPDAIDWRVDHSCPAFFDVSLLSSEYPSATPDGRPVGPSIWSNDAPMPFFIYGTVGPFAHFTLYSDHMFLATVLPNGPEETRIECLWCADASANADEEHAVWLWDNTIRQDIDLVERLNRGRSAPGAFEPVFLDIESQAGAFHDWVHRRGFEPGGAHDGQGAAAP